MNSARSHFRRLGDRLHLQPKCSTGETQDLDAPLLRPPSFRALRIYRRPLQRPASPTMALLQHRASITMPPEPPYPPALCTMRDRSTTPPGRQGQGAQQHRRLCQGASHHRTPLPLPRSSRFLSGFLLQPRALAAIPRHLRSVVISFKTCAAPRPTLT